MENFITGYPGHEFEIRRAMKEEMGEEKYNYFFDKASVLPIQGESELIAGALVGGLLLHSIRCQVSGFTRLELPEDTIQSQALYRRPQPGRYQGERL